MQLLAQFSNFDEIFNQSFIPDVVLWDMDGTILQTEKYHALTTLRYLETLGKGDRKSYQELFDLCEGRTDQQVFNQLVADGIFITETCDEYILMKNDIFLSMIKDMTPLEIFSEKIRSLILEIKQKNIRQAVVTSSESAVAKALLKSLDILEHFEFILGCDNVKETKPSPFPYELAMQRLEVRPQQVAIFEDSTTGIAAAVKSGANVYKVEWYLNYPCE